MTKFRTVFLVARRDFLQRVRSRIFLISMALMVVLILGAGPFLIAQVEPDAIQLGVVGLEADQSTLLASVADSVSLDVELVDVTTRAEGVEMLEEGDLDVVLAGGETVWREEPWPSLYGVIVQAARAEDQQRVIADLGLTNAEAAALLAPEPPSVTSLEEPTDINEAQQAGAYIGVMILFMAIVLSGQFVLLGVLEEKSTRVAEVVLARVRPVEFLAGKVLGIGALGLLQLFVLGASVFGLASVAEVEGLPELQSIASQMLGSIALWFLLGYTMYSVLFAMAGSLVSRQEDVQSVSWIPMMGLLPGYFLAIFATGDPESLVVRVASLFPITAPMVMPVRAANTAVPAWEYGLAIALTLGAAYLVVRLAARIYAGGMLRSGRTKLREAWKGAG